MTHSGKIEKELSLIQMRPPIQMGLATTRTPLHLKKAQLDPE